MRISVLIPAHNEERSIQATVNSCLNQTRPFDEIIVVNDGSTDTTGAILATFGNKIKVVTLAKATGNKSYAQERGLMEVTGDVFVGTDADTLLDKRFVEKVLPHFKDPKVAAVAGYVKSMKNNWLTACREIDYTIGQDLHKTAQANIGFLFVIPGCAGAFRTETFKNAIKFDHDTLTEDLDFTYKLHLGYHKINFEQGAIVYTQDPFTLHSYVNQLRRWNSGGWQNLMKHWRGIISRPAIALELSLMYFEGITFSFLLFVLPFLNISFFTNFVAGYFVFMALIGAYAAIRRRRWDLFLLSPLYVFLVFVNAWIFLEQFIKEMVFRRKTLVWFKPERKAIT